MNKFVVVLVVLAVTGCTTNVKTHAVRGVSGIEIDCSGLGSGWDKCYRRAERECKEEGYKVVVRSSDAKEEDEDYLFGWNPAGYLTRTLVVICR
ncbi:hypothetical protein [Pseudomonas sp. Irchel s3h17]|uniref:hypothetical protein n=1 Tax=Pseudomonas sp. Irchel s3h17 TaxID=2009182 RepID=UPI000BA358A6|nr:hypothetical protein [Pseudomonas sp. Irchel s3h17]